jgi:hypothetical protein
MHSFFSKKPFWLVLASATAISMYLYSQKDNVVPNKAYQSYQGAELAKIVQSESNSAQREAGSNFLFATEKPPLSLPKADGDGQQYYDDLLNESPETVWEQWKWLLRTNGDELEITDLALSQVLQSKPSDQVYEDIRTMLNNSSFPLQQRASLVSLLARIATPESLDIILAAIQGNAVDTELRPSLLRGIETVGNYRWNGRFHIELSPALESAWKKSLGDEELHSTLAFSIAALGAPNGVELLMTGLQQSLDVGEAYSLAALKRVRNPEALPVLTRWYDSDRISNSQVRDELKRLIIKIKNISVHDKNS